MSNELPVPVCRCGAGPHPDDPQRCAKGHGLPGHALSLKHGQYSDRAAVELWRELADVTRQREEAMIADLGGPENTSTAARGLVTELARIRAAADHVWGGLEQDGLLTSKGRTRAATSLYLALIERATKLSLALGLERKARRLPNPLDYVNGRTDE